MRRTLVLVLVLSLCLGTLAVAEAKKKKKKPKPIATTLFMEGEGQFGEVEQLNLPPAKSGTFLYLQAEAGSGEKSMMVPNYVGGPNTQCAGNSLVPVFVGDVVGQITGDLKVTFVAQATPGTQAEVRVWPDIAAQACNDSYVEPAGSVMVPLPSSKGPVEAVIEGLNFAAAQNIMIQITHVPGVPPTYGRAFYGTDASKVEFSCLPPAGAKSCVPPPAEE